ncbi:membrane fusion protein, Cu(I)/Ag(I) efflux system [Mesonia phycicola]|uniref:Membrane fusion protein, Cu(I)/Ag(I) efflux system n=1 Tax=Mesonia phycicola TaxID=579105 RepID=A0A1M6FMT9_9FLAO|nr:efflux RND transporter periplasmic adaptor subunit [Mesonia phycicola]SHI98929.1 membrane fusion protein, Cu(I)/Ag(I) efflux system [Mesonia phycicola]
MKKYLIYILLLIVGVFLGYLFFNSSEKNLEKTQTPLTAETNELWTCSMHPQIIREEPGDCPICGMELIPLETNGSELSENQFSLSKNAMALANIETTVVGQSSSTANKVTLSGKITENKEETATQPAHFNGRIEKLYVNSLGEYVKMGQPVAVIYSPDLVAAQQELISAYKNKKNQPRLYEAVRNKFKNWRIHENQLKKIEQSKKPLTKITIYSHVAGVVTSIDVTEGAHIMDGKPIFKVSNLSTVWAELDAYENEMYQFKKGQPILVKADAYPTQEFKTTINFIDPVLNATTRTLVIRAELQNKNKLLKPGMFITGYLENDNVSKKNLISVPKSAVMWTGERSTVYLKVDKNLPVFEMREIQLGNETGNTYAVLHGLQKGDEIVTNGTFTVDAAAQLQGKKSMMTAENNLLSINEENTGKFYQIVDNYLSIKNNLVKTDSTAAQLSAQKTLALLKNISTGEEKLQQEFQKLQENLLLIRNTSSIVKQREYFITLSQNIIQLAKQIASTQQLYVQKCPMTNNNKGATWISLSKKIENPYYGNSMLQCGSVIDVIN